MVSNPLAAATKHKVSNARSMAATKLDVQNPDKRAGCRVNP